MQKKELIALLNGFPDEVEIELELNPGGQGHLIDQYGVVYGCNDKTKDSSHPENATHVAIYEKVESDREDIFPEQVRLGLPEEFLDKCAEYQITPEEVLHGFISDLCELHNYTNNPRPDGLNSHGSDERMLANQYYERTWYKG